MSETETTTTTETATEPVTDHAAEAEKWKALSRKNESDFKKAQKELDTLRQSQMSEQEKAIAQATDAAKAEGKAEAFREVGARLVSAEVRAVAAGRIEAAKLDVLIDGLNTSAFLTDDGQVDTAKVTALVDGLAPAATEPAAPTFPELGQGKGGGKSASADPLVQALTSKVGGPIR